MFLFLLWLVESWRALGRDRQDVLILQPGAGSGPLCAGSSSVAGGEGRVYLPGPSFKRPQEEQTPGLAGLGSADESALPSIEPGFLGSCHLPVERQAPGISVLQCLGLLSVVIATLCWNTGYLFDGCKFWYLFESLFQDNYTPSLLVSTSCSRTHSLGSLSGEQAQGCPKEGGFPLLILPYVVFTRPVQMSGKPSVSSGAQDGTGSIGRVGHVCDFWTIEEEPYLFCWK